MEKAINKVTPIKKQPEEWEVQWERCKPLIEKAIEYQAQGAGWQQVQSLASNLGGTFGNIFDTSNQQMKSPQTPGITQQNVYSGGQIAPSFMRGN